MRLELDGITAVHLAQVFMGPQISHIGGCTGLDAEVLDEIDAVNVGLVLPVEKTYDIVAVRELSNQRELFLELTLRLNGLPTKPALFSSISSLF